MSETAVITAQTAGVTPASSFVVEEARRPNRTKAPWARHRHTSPTRSNHVTPPTLSDSKPRLAETVEPPVPITSSATAAWVIVTLTGITFVGSISSGLVTIALPTIALDLDLPPHLLLCILTNNFVPGPQRNVGFACIGLSQPLGFAVGLVFGGVIVDTTLGWRFSFYFTAGLMALLFVLSIWLLPKDKPQEAQAWRRAGREIDWIGAGLASAALGISSYIFAILTGDLYNIKRPENIALLLLSGCASVGFVFWMSYREKSGRTPLIPNSLWRNKSFSIICVLVLLSYAVLNSLEYFISLYFQKVQHLSGLEAAIRFLPEIAAGVLLNLCTGLFVHKVHVSHLITVTSILTVVSPLLMALINPASGYWIGSFWAVLLCPFNVDVIFTVANLIITDAFPASTQALAGAVFNTIAQFGWSLGLTIMAITSSRVTVNSPYQDKESSEAILPGYQAVFWVCVGLQALACVVSASGLRGVGKIGLKLE
ncbi:integral membrane protein [Lasiosphaeria ovina]|uniref:Integral membrane protein n=1 Tax=Lasiosphaeria ovina TaxID=92902 RepID=A0AAE0NKS9_9PEZI|nr:integral membrane protein [Lasiosphaeria ovina]